jgi:hypothetical protein
MTKEIKIKTGKKISTEEQKKLDINQMGVLINSPHAEVEGQAEICGEYVQCPACGMLGRLTPCEGPIISWTICGNCGARLRV